MKTVLIISSFVSASRVGATASAFCMRRLGIEVIILPTTLFGRHPGWGSPGGTSTPPEILRDMWAGIKAQDILFDGVMTGYMADPDHVALACDIIDHVKNNNPKADILVDPVMGDHGKLYVKNGVAKAICNDLIHRADMTTPNVWELNFLLDKKAETIEDIERALSSLPMKVMVTSVHSNSEIGVLYKDNHRSALITHPKYTSVPNGGGDSLAATFFALYLSDLPPIDALARATASIFAIIKAAQKDDLGELPLIRMQDALVNTPPFEIRTPPYDRHAL